MGEETTERTMPTWDVVSQRISQYLADEGREWCGFPIPVEHLTLTLEDKNPFFAAVAALERGDAADDAVAIEHVCSDEDTGLRLINTWYSIRHRADVVIVDDNGKRKGGLINHDAAVRFKAYFGTLQASQAWSLDAELQAQLKLKALVKPHLFDAYVMTGTLVETSERSGVTYMFRRCRPTLAVKPKFGETDMRMLCALCLHPIGFYECTWAGVMTPTDEVICHLMLMRGDEAMYWRRSNQHPPHSPLAGV